MSCCCGIFLTRGFEGSTESFTEVASSASLLDLKPAWSYCRATGHSQTAITYDLSSVQY
jgi:hypothetical protein